MITQCKITGWKIRRNLDGLNLIRQSTTGNDVREDGQMYSREQWIPSVAKTIKGQQCVRVAAILKRSLEFERTKGWITLTKWHDMRTLRGHALFPFEHDTRFFFRFKLEIWINRIFFFFFWTIKIIRNLFEN